MNTAIKKRALWPILALYCFANSIAPAVADSAGGSTAATITKTNAPTLAAAKKKKKKKKKPSAPTPKPTPQSDRPLCLTIDGQILVPAGASCPSNSTAATLQSFLTQGTSGDIGPQGPKGDTGDAGASGPAGPIGPQGADGALRIFGDGSRLDLDPPSSATLTELNTQYANVNIQSGVILTVPSGTVIRCTGTFTNAGTIVVTPVGAGGYRSAYTGTTYFPALRAPDAGNSSGAAGSGEYGTSSAALVGGLASPGLDATVAARLLSPGIKGGGGGAAGRRDAGLGGGALTVLCAGAILNTGSIIANGTDAPTPTGGGGGAGGIIILGSNTSITSVGSSLITANGGRGSDAAAGIDLVSTTNGAGGGGGGGVITLISPNVTTNVTSNLEVLGGVPGSITGVTGTGSRRVGGGAGGSFGGKGGDGGGVARNSGAPTAAEAGSVGIKTVIDALSQGITDIAAFRF